MASQQAKSLVLMVGETIAALAGQFLYLVRKFFNAMGKSQLLQVFLSSALWAYRFIIQ